MFISIENIYIYIYKMKFFLNNLAKRKFSKLRNIIIWVISVKLNSAEIDKTLDTNSPPLNSRFIGACKSIAVFFWV